MNLPVLRPFLMAMVLALVAGCVVVVADPSGLLRGPGLKEVTLEGSGRDKLLLLDLTGLISDRPRRGSLGLSGAPSLLAEVEASLQRAARDRRVRALVLRIESPGGTVSASDELYARLRAFKAERDIPIVAALGGIATSGAYYVACAADTLVVQPAGVTGSIGVVLWSLNLEGLAAKLGVADASYTAGANKNLLSPLHTATPEQRRLVQGILDGMHARFVAVVRERRPAVDAARLNELADGRIFGAEDAVALGLADRVGRLHDALDLAAGAAGLEQARVVTYRRGGPARETVYAGLNGGAALSGPALTALFEGAGQPQFLYLWQPGLGP